MRAGFKYSYRGLTDLRATTLINVTLKTIDKVEPINRITGQRTPFKLKSHSKPYRTQKNPKPVSKLNKTLNTATNQGSKQKANKFPNPNCSIRKLNLNNNIKKVKSHSISKLQIKNHYTICLQLLM